MNQVYLKIVENGNKYGKYVLMNHGVVKYDRIAQMVSWYLRHPEFNKPTKRKVRLYVNGVFLHYLLREISCCLHYRKKFIEHFYNEASDINSILFVLVPAEKEIIDYSWNSRISYLVRERCELEHALSWLSTLGGAFSALGDYFTNFASVAGKISYHQLVLAIRMGDPTIASRCKLYFSLSLIQQKRFKLARRIICAEYDYAKKVLSLDSRLVKMCLGIWSKLQYEHLTYVQAKSLSRVRIE